MVEIDLSKYENDPPSIRDQRLCALSKTFIDHKIFRILCAQARELFSAPFAGISFLPKTTEFLDEDRLYNVVMLPAEEALCLHTVRKKSIFSVTELHFHPIYAKNPFVVAAPFIRSYIGCPIFDRSQIPIGTFCVLDTKDRVFTDVDYYNINEFALRAKNFVELLGLINHMNEFPEVEKLLMAADLVAYLGHKDAAEHMINLAFAACDLGDVSGACS